jgi:hypothetical protein
VWEVEKERTIPWPKYKVGDQLFDMNYGNIKVEEVTDKNT